MRTSRWLVVSVATLLLLTPRVGRTQAAQQDVIQTLNGAGTFSTFTKLLADAGLTETLKGPGPFTVFAPTDEALSKLPAGRLDALTKDKNALRQAMLYHIVAGRLTSADVAKLNGRGARTMELSEAKVSMMGTTIMINNAHVVTPDMAARNGIIHSIDGLIMPPGR